MIGFGDSMGPGGPEDPSTFAGQVDSLEILFGQYFSQFRRSIEDALVAHMDNLRSIDVERQMEFSKLKAENAMLREQTGGLDGDPCLLQAVMHEQSNNKDDKKRKGRERSGSVTSSFPDGRKKGLAGNRDRDTAWLSGGKGTGKGNSRPGRMGAQLQRKQASEPKGRWEQFVAWVPDGSSLKNPEPWSALPESDQRSNYRGATQPSTMAEENESNEGLSNHSSETRSTVQTEIKGFSVLTPWAATKDQLQVLRVSSIKQRFTQRDRPSQFAVVPVAESECSSDHSDMGIYQWASWRSRHAKTIKNDSYSRITWDITSLLLILYDMAIMPMSVFDLPHSVVWDIFEWIGRIFWTLDIVMSCCTEQVLADGSIERSLAAVTKMYLKSWAPIDAVIVLCLWLEVILSSGTLGTLGIMKNLIRAARVVRLLRIYRMKKIAGVLLERYESDSEKISLVLSIFKLVVFVLTFAHANACIWWALGSRNTDSMTWASSSSSSFLVHDVEAQYLMSLHWAMSQLTGGMDEVHPQSSLERFYTICVWLVGFFAAALTVSMLSSGMTQMHIIRGSQARQLSNLRKYLNQNSISRNLSLRMQRSATHALSADLSPEYVDLLPVISEPLRIEMHFEMYASVMSKHPYFSECIIDSPHVMRRVCHTMTVQFLDGGEVVFCEGDVQQKPKVFFVMKGSLMYRTDFGDILVEEKQTVAEAYLWTAWHHHGTLTAVDQCQLAILDCEAFVEIVEKSKNVVPDPKLYAADFCEFLNIQDESKLNDLAGLSARRKTTRTGNIPLNNPLGSRHSYDS